VFAAGRTGEEVVVDCTWPIRGSDLLGLPVRIGRVDVGEVRDLLCSRDLGHVLGLEIAGHDRQPSFLPWIAADIAADHVAVRSVVSLLSTSELAIYVDYGVRFSQRANGRGAGLAVEREGQLAAAPPRNAAA
jgi:hypothetical protein